MKKATIELVLKRDGVDSAEKALDQVGVRGEAAANRVKSAFSATDQSIMRHAQQWRDLRSPVMTMEQAVEREMGATRQAMSATNGLADSYRKMKDASAMKGADAMASMIRASDPFQQQAKAMNAATDAAGKHSLAMGRVNQTLEALAFQTLGANARLGSLSSKFLEFGVGGMATGALLAGLAVIAFAWDKITEKAEKAKQEQLAAAAAISGLRSQQANPILGDVPHQRELLVQRRQDLTDELAQAEQMSRRFVGTTNLFGLIARSLYGDPEKIRHELADITRLIQVAGNEENRLKALANEPTRQAGIESIKNQLDIELKREQLRSRIAAGGHLVSGTPKSDLELQRQANAAALVATKQQIDAEFRRVDATGQVLALTEDERKAKQKLIDQANELNGLANRQAGVEADIAKQINKALQLAGSDSLRDRHKGRLEMIEIERRAEIQKTGDVETAQLRAEQAIRAERLKTINEFMTQGKSGALVQGTLGVVDKLGGSSAVGLLQSGIAAFGSSGWWGVAQVGITSLVGAITGSGRAAREAALRFKEVTASLENTILSWRAEIGQPGAQGALDTRRIIAESDAARKALYKLYGMDDNGHPLPIVKYNNDLLSEYYQKLKEINELEKARIDNLSKEEEVIRTQLTRRTLVQSVVDQQRDTQITTLTKSLSDITSALDSLKSFRSSLSLSDLSPLSPTARLSEARKQYEDILGRARAGDASAAGQLPAVARAFLEASRAVNASSGAYQSDFARVTRESDEIIKLFEAQRDLQQQQLDALNAIKNGLASWSTADEAGTNRIIEAIGHLGDQLTGLGEGIARPEALPV